LEKKGEKVPEKKESKEHYTGSVVGFLPEAEEEVTPKHKKKTVKVQTDKVMAAPSVRRFAKQLNVDLIKLNGTGPEGRVTEEDVKAAAGLAKEAPKATIKITKKYDLFGYVKRVPLKGIRKVISEKMSEAVANTAMVTHHDDIDVTELNRIRKQEKEKAAKKNIHVTFMPFIIKGCVEAIKKHPYVMSSMEGEEIFIKKYYNFGIAMDTKDGLMAPVVKGVDQKDIQQLSKEMQELADKANNRKLDLMDFKGGSFSITNVGALGGTYFTPIVNYPELCILGTGRIEDKPIAKDGKVVIRKIMPISFTYDHRVLDGAEAARFCKDLKELLENPKSLTK